MARSRANRRIAAIAGVAVVGAILAIVVVAVWLRFGPSRTQAAPSSSVAAQSSQKTTTATATTPTPKTPATEPTSTSAPQVPTATEVAAAAASSKAVEKAAVPFPGAPSLPASSKSINHLHPKHKYVAITLDDGYGFQPQMLDLLEQYDARCTTFLIGSWAASNKPILKRLDKAGFEIANHTWDHKTLTKLSTAQINSELARTQTVISSITGNQAPYMRPPGGGSNASVRAASAAKGYRVIMWNRTFGDSGRGATPKKLYDNAIVSGGGVQPGDIILCHWGSKVSYEAMKRVLADLKAQGYQCVTISELIADSNGK